MKKARSGMKTLMLGICLVIFNTSLLQEAFRFGYFLFQVFFIGMFQRQGLIEIFNGFFILVLFEVGIPKMFINCGIIRSDFSRLLKIDDGFLV